MQRASNAPLEEGMARTTVEREILDLETQYWQAIKNNDPETAERLSHDPCIISGPQGLAKLDKKSLADVMRNPAYTVHNFKIGDDAQVELLDDDVAVLAYNVHEELTVNGKRLEIDAADTSTWIRRNGRWECALHTESLRGDPFGRDRRS
jgi:hypothetical protein